MIPRIWLINVILALCILFSGSRAYRVWTHEEPSGPIESIEDYPAPAVEKRQTSKQGTLRESAYRVIAERSLFTPDRAELLSEESDSIPVENSPLVAGRRVNLHGVIIRGNDRRALIDNPNREPKQPPRKWVRVGEILGDWTVDAIEPESVLLREGANTYKIPLYTKESGSSSRSPDGGRSTSSPTVVNTETQQPSSVPEVVSSGTGTGEKRETPRTGTRKGNEAAGETETIVTPFGTITRKKGGE